MKRGFPKTAAGFGLTFGVVVFLAVQVHAVRIKDISEIKGVRSNQLVGYGLVVGLNGTGDGNDLPFTSQSMASMLEKLGPSVKADDIEVDNVAAVMVTANLPPFARSGSRIDALVSSIGDAESLEGGTLLMTPLKGADGRVYAVAQGAVSIGGFSAGGQGATVRKNFPTVGRVIQGALIEREIATRFNEKRRISLSLHNADFTTAHRVTKAINNALGDELAQCPDAGTVKIAVPERYSGHIVELVTLIEGLQVSPDSAAKVVVNERTGTVVMGENVRVSKVAVTHGNLSVEVKESAEVSQPQPLSQGETVVAPETQISAREERAPLFLLEPGVSIGEVVKALNSLGVSSRDLIAILQAMKAAGALKADLEII